MPAHELRHVKSFLGISYHFKNLTRLKIDFHASKQILKIRSIKKMKLNFTIKGKVKAKQSVKFGHNGIKYTPRDMVEYANLVRMSFINAYPDWNTGMLADKPLKAEINVFMPVPKSYSKKKTEQALQNEIRPTVKPDCDNIAKNINDALNGIAYPDDKQIVSLTVNKYYSSSEYVEVKITD